MLLSWLDRSWTGNGTHAMEPSFHLSYLHIFGCNFFLADGNIQRHYLFSKLSNVGPWVPRNQNHGIAVTDSLRWFTATRCPATKPDPPIAPGAQLVLKMSPEGVGTSTIKLYCSSCVLPEHHFLSTFRWSMYWLIASPLQGWREVTKQDWLSHNPNELPSSLLTTQWAIDSVS